MSVRMTLGLLLAVALLPVVARAEGQKFSDLMRDAHAQYAAAHKALAGDSFEGVDTAAAAIEKLSGSLGKASDLAAQPESLRQLPVELAAAAAKLSAAKELEGKRTAFRELSDGMVKWVKASRPESLRIIYCPMAKASWLQVDKPIRNPYYGKSMLECGKDVTDSEPAAASGSHDSH